MSDALDRLRVRSALRDTERDDLSLDTVEGEEDDYNAGWEDSRKQLPPKTTSGNYYQGYNDGIAMNWQG